ncbi:DUF4184 family protein [Thermobifida alba]|uniref:DUF4184 family protein n=1 Tax=Thermobifida alba TaxID=53522 RepID=A0ABY4KVY5_THEAE|nr:DUF4184 family protein [Thermobifida alba]UPT19590.1 DUF4184 family protein [Thermobifida alba]
MGGGPVLWTVLSLALGAATHVVWDAFTHPGGAAVVLWPVLDAEVAGAHRLYNVVMSLGSAGGLGVLAWWVARWYRRAPVAPAGGAALPGEGARRWAAAGIVVAGVAEAGRAAADPRAAASGYDLVRGVLLGLAQGVGAGLACHVAVWHVLRAVRGRVRVGDGAAEK